MSNFISLKQRQFPAASCRSAAVAALNATKCTPAAPPSPASIFHFGEHSVREAKQYMARAGLPVRLDP